MSLFNKANELAVLAVGRKQQFTQQTVFIGPPTDNFSGIDVRGAVKAAVNVLLRENPLFLTTIVDIGYAAGTTYRVTINGTNVDVNAEFNREITLGEIETAINANPTTSAIVTATLSPTRGVVITGKTPDNYTITGSITTGTGTITITGDVLTAQNYYLWAFVNGVGWGQIDSGEVTTRGLFSLIDCAPFDRLYIEIEQAHQVRIGKGVLE
jgi:hypothetical protein